MLILEEILKWHLEAFASEREKEGGGVLLFILFK